MLSAPTCSADKRAIRVRINATEMSYFLRRSSFFRSRYRVTNTAATGPTTIATIATTSMASRLHVPYFLETSVDRANPRLNAICGFRIQRKWQIEGYSERGRTFSREDSRDGRQPGRKREFERADNVRLVGYGMVVSGAPSRYRYSVRASCCSCCSSRHAHLGAKCIQTIPQRAPSGSAGVGGASAAVSPCCCRAPIRGRCRSPRAPAASGRRGRP